MLATKHKTVADDPLLIDQHKLMYHPGHVAKWLDAGNDWQKLKKIGPVYVEISPVGKCNHRCVFCAIDYTGYKGPSLDADVLNERFLEMANYGTRSVMFAGEGEPLFHKRIDDLVHGARKARLDVSFTTNAVMLKEDFVRSCLSEIAWIKVSLNAGSDQNYQTVHRAPAGDYQKVLDNLRFAVAYRNEHGLSCKLGAQMVLIEENLHEVEQLTEIVRDLGVDYFVIKPYSQHKKSLHSRPTSYDQEALEDIRQNCLSMANDKFHVVFRSQAIHNVDHTQRKYQKCYSVPFFWAYLISTGELIGCSAYWGDQRFSFGNIQEQSFAEVWESEKRKENWQFVQEGLNICDCRKGCRMDVVNDYLWRLKQPEEHDNFI